MRDMLADGATRTAQRQQNVRSFREHDRREEATNDLLKQKAKKRNDLSSSEDDDALDFIRPMMKQFVDDPSLKRRDLKHHHKKR